MIEELLFIVLPYTAAALLALAVPVLAIVQYRLAAHLPADLRVATLLVVMALGAMATVVLTPRMLNEDLFKPEFVYASDFASGFMASRVLSALVVGAALVEIARAWRDAQRRGEPDPARPLLLALLAFYVGTPVFQLVGSDHPGLALRSLYAPIVLAAICSMRLERIDRVLLVAKACILACTFGSLVAAVAAPDFAVARPSPGLLPGVDFRLFGLAPHANTLGPVALAGLLLELHAPSRWRSLRWASLASAVLALLLAQSKTAWVAAIAIAVFTWLPLSVMPTVRPRLAARAFSRAALTLIACLVLIAGAAVAVALADIDGYLARHSSLLTLSGRLRIWQITLDEWRNNVLFGYGPGLWSPEYMLSQNMRHVGQAHNQFVQTLGDAGALGLTVLLVYLVTLALAGLRRFRASCGLIFALYVLLLLRCLTEATLRSDGPLSWALFIHVLLLVLACHHLRQPRTDPEPVRPDTSPALMTWPRTA